MDSDSPVVRFWLISPDGFAPSYREQWLELLDVNHQNGRWAFIADRLADFAVEGDDDDLDLDAAYRLFAESSVRKDGIPFFVDDVPPLDQLEAAAEEIDIQAVAWAWGLEPEYNTRSLQMLLDNERRVRAMMGRELGFWPRMHLTPAGMQALVDRLWWEGIQGELGLGTDEQDAIEAWESQDKPDGYDLDGVIGRLGPRRERAVGELADRWLLASRWLDAFFDELREADVDRVQGYVLLDEEAITELLGLMEPVGEELHRRNLDLHPQTMEIGGWRGVLPNPVSRPSWSPSVRA